MCFKHSKESKLICIDGLTKPLSLSKLRPFEALNQSSEPHGFRDCLMFFPSVRLWELMGPMGTAILDHGMSDKKDVNRYHLTLLYTVYNRNQCVVELGIIHTCIVLWYKPAFTATR